MSTEKKPGEVWSDEDREDAIDRAIDEARRANLIGDDLIAKVDVVLPDDVRSYLVRAGIRERAYPEDLSGIRIIPMDPEEDWDSPESFRNS